MNWEPNNDPCLRFETVVSALESGSSGATGSSLHLLELAKNQAVLELDFEFAAEIRDMIDMKNNPVDMGVRIRW